MEGSREEPKPGHGNKQGVETNQIGRARSRQAQLAATTDNFLPALASPAQSNALCSVPIDLYF